MKIQENSTRTRYFLWGRPPTHSTKKLTHVVHPPPTNPPTHPPLTDQPGVLHYLWFNLTLTLTLTHNWYQATVEAPPNDIIEVKLLEMPNNAPCFVLFCFVLFCFIFQDYCRAERSARRYILGETLLLRGRRPHLIQYILGIIGEAAE